MRTIFNAHTTIRIVILIILNLFITSCAGSLTRAKRIAATAELKSTVLNTKNFKIQSFYRFSKKGKPLTIYIEGDGQAWLTSSQPSLNPTPRNPLALKLAVLDKGENIMHLARPCQYTNLYYEKLCSIPYWTHKRFSKEIILAIDESINIMASRAKSKRIHLVGYSGGGAIVAMVAARRKDIASIRTVAGYMDHVALNYKTKVSQLIGSLDPIKAAPRLKKIPQIHYSGKQDKRVPGWVLRNFRKAVGSRDCVTLRQVNSYHEEGWEEVWAKIWSIIPTCRN